ncbi:hypothetical protein GW17_00034358 [Ensete ventricosum]|nr:hypothetical protein GW17_00034358 [Ensete ventricosum]
MKQHCHSLLAKLLQAQTECHGVGTLSLLADVDMAVTSSRPRIIGPSTWLTRCGKSVWRRYGGVSGRTVDLAQVKSTPLTCRRMSHRKDGKRGGEVRWHGFLHSHPTPRRSWSRPSTSGYGADHSPVPTPAHAFDSSPIGSPGDTPANGVTSSPKPEGPAQGGAATTPGRRSPSSFPNSDASPFTKSLLRPGSDRSRLRHPIVRHR